MKTDNRAYRNLARKITINLSRQHELKQQYELLLNHKKMLDIKIDQLLKEVKALTGENSDLKEIVHALNQENEHYRQQR